MTTLLLPLCTVLFLCYATIGLPLPVLPGHVHHTLGFDAFLVALTIGVQSVSTLATRHLAGTMVDVRGPRRAVWAGALVCTLACGVYLASIPFAAHSHAASLDVLLFGRAILGFGESLVTTGVLTWSVALVGRERAGRAMAWVGISMYGALAVGAPVGAAIAKAYGFAGVSAAAMAAPLLGILVMRASPDVKPAGAARTPFHRVLGVVWRQGAGLTLATLGFGTLAAFGPLYYQAHGWSGSAVALTAFGAAYIFARLLFGTFPDRFGGTRVAVVSLTVEILGQLLLAQAGSPAGAIAGATLTGFGFSLVFPSLGVEAVRHAPPANRGVVLGAYVAFFDVAIGLLVPLSGGLVRAMGYGAAFLAGAAASGVALVLTLNPSRFSFPRTTRASGQPGRTS
ncbi:MFS transporter [Pendulispora brunnea]|uniref:MFS transporter n=1 Tax=Pendulispora brunnea TaxID=2905690 RepID=A0ABZ2KGM0_9BACT